MFYKFYLLIICCFLLPFSAHAANVEKSLNHQYKRHVMVLQHSPLNSGDLKFDSSGRSMVQQPSVSWLTYGGIYIEKISLAADALRFEGHRVAFGKDSFGDRSPIFFGNRIEIEIH